MSEVFIKICGLRTRDAVQQAVAAGADALGFVFAESCRRVGVAEAAEITRDVPASVARVAVMREPSADEWREVADSFRPDWLQMEASHFGVIDVADGIVPLPVYRDTPQLDEQALTRSATALFEGVQSGAGQVADWNRAARLARRTRLVLAGGLNPENVVAAIDAVRPWGVDVSSGVESSRGVKDNARIVAFIDAVRHREKIRAD
jgi:phosphoribosylanthranilate isomerase